MVELSFGQVFDDVKKIQQVKLLDDPNGGNIFFHDNPHGKQCGIVIMGGDAWKKVLLNWDVVRNKEIIQQQQQEEGEKGEKGGEVLRDDRKGGGKRYFCYCRTFFWDPKQYIAHVKKSYRPANMPLMKWKSDALKKVFFTWKGVENFKVNIDDLEKIDIARFLYPQSSNSRYYTTDFKKSVTKKEMSDINAEFHQYMLYHIGETEKMKLVSNTSVVSKYDGSNEGMIADIYNNQIEQVSEEAGYDVGELLYWHPDSTTTDVRELVESIEEERQQLLLQHQQQQLLLQQQQQQLLQQQQQPAVSPPTTGRRRPVRRRLNFDVDDTGPSPPQIRRMIDQ